jgi:hypothetical protein
MPQFSFGGGLNQLNDIAIRPDECVEGQNFELELGNQKFRRRPVIDLLDTTPNTSRINGIHQLFERDGTKTTLVMSGTQAYTWDGSAFVAVGPALAASSRFNDHDWDLDETIIITDREKATVVLEWDGTTLAALTTGLGSNLFAKYGLVADGRNWLANITEGATLLPNVILASAFEDREDYDTAARGGTAGSFTTGQEAFFLVTPNTKPINGFIRFQNVTIVSTEGGEMFKLVGDDATNYRFEDFYSGSAAIGDSSFVDAGDDVYYMRTGGVIESLRSTDRFGDVGTDDISIQIPTEVEDATGAKIVYDQKNKKILFFFDSKCMVLYKNLLNQEASPWSKYKTQHPSAFNTDAARFMEYPESNNADKTILYGDDNGNIFDLNGSGVMGDMGSFNILAQRKLPLQDANYRNIIAGRIFYRRRGQCQLNMNFEWGDEKNTTDLTVILKGINSALVTQNFYNAGVYYAGGSYYSEGGTGSTGNPVSKGFSAVGKGTSVFVTLGIETTEEFEIDYIEA